MEPLTGRRHQLRIHCHSLGHTILGDYTYSDRSDTKPKRMYLHAYKIDLPNTLEGVLWSVCQMKSYFYLVLRVYTQKVCH